MILWSLMPEEIYIAAGDQVPPSRNNPAHSRRRVMGTFGHVKEAVYVTPSDPTPTRLLSLSAIDSQLFLRFTVEYLLIYRAGNGLDRASISSRIKTGLAKALVPYYPLAGRVRAKADGSSLEVVCRAQGALFLEAVSEEAVADFEKPPRRVSEWRKLLAFHVEDVLKGAPPLVVQLTWLQDGDAALGVAFNHCICDGIGSSEFLNSFAELATGLTGLTKIKNRPVWDRHLLNAQAFNQLPHSKSVTLPEFNPVQDLCRFMTRFSEDQLVPTSITFDDTSLRELRNLASDAEHTSFEVLSAHIWRSWARAMRLPRSQTLKLLFSINVRKIVKPNLPSGYYGNAFVLGCAQTSAEELEEKGLGYAAGLVKKAKERVGDEYVRKVVESVSESRACPDSVGVLILSQWSRLGLERIDFGMGRPVHVGPVCCDRYCLLLPVYDRKDAVKVMLAVPRSAVDDYESLARLLIK